MHCLQQSECKKGGRWVNNFSDDKEENDTIEELWEYQTHDFLHDYSEMTARVVFAKNPKGKYEFYGVYECVACSEERKAVEWCDTVGFVKKNCLISKCYPLKTD